MEHETEYGYLRHGRIVGNIKSENIVLTVNFCMKHTNTQIATARGYNKLTSEKINAVYCGTQICYKKWDN